MHSTKELQFLGEIYPLKPQLEPLFGHHFISQSPSIPSPTHEILKGGKYNSHYTDCRSQQCWLICMRLRNMKCRNLIRLSSTRLSSSPDPDPCSSVVNGRTVAVRTHNIFPLGPPTMTRRGSGSVHAAEVSLVTSSF